jgi:predicted TIM-barrel enzyme
MLLVVENAGVAEHLRAVVAQIEPDISIADGAIVCTSLKVDGVTWNPVDVERANRMVELTRRVREHAG